MYRPLFSFFDLPTPFTYALLGSCVPSSCVLPRLQRHDARPAPLSLRAYYELHCDQISRPSIVIPCISRASFVGDLSRICRRGFKVYYRRQGRGKSLVNPTSVHTVRYYGLGRGSRAVLPGVARFTIRFRVSRGDMKAQKRGHALLTQNTKHKTHTDEHEHITPEGEAYRHQDAYGAAPKCSTPSFIR